MRLFEQRVPLEAMVVNYLWPVTGTPTPPTPTQAMNVNTVVATVSPTSGPDAQVAITHNFQLPNSDISSGWPTCHVAPLDSLGLLSGWFQQSFDPNYVGLARLTSNQSEDTVPQIKVTILRPHTITR